MLGACQRMALKNLKLRTRVVRRPKAEAESAPIPPPWYLATKGNPLPSPSSFLAMNLIA